MTSRTATTELIEILSPGLRASLQGLGRIGWRRYGVPPGGAMDDHAARFANRLLDNPHEAPVLELLLQGARLRVLQSCWLAITGALANANFPPWHALRLEAGQVIQFPRNQTGVWIYVALEGGFAHSKSRADAPEPEPLPLGQSLRPGDRLHCIHHAPWQPGPEIAGRFVDWNEQRNYDAPPVLRAWPGPQWEAFEEDARQSFQNQSWTITPQSDRIGYRLQGTPLKMGLPPIISEPVRVGSIQVPENGLPIVTMRDGPTVGGYPKIAMVDPRDLSWLAQVRPGHAVSFRMVTEPKG